MTEAGRVAAVILAAGASRRYGSPKQLALLEGRTLFEHVLELALRAELSPIVAVVPVWLTRPTSMADVTSLTWIRNPHPERGMSHSLRLGFAALPSDVDAAVILLGDQPRVPVAHLRALIAARGQRPLVASQYEGLLAPPVVVERSHFDLVATPRGDIGLRGLLRAHPDRVASVKAARPLDVDTPDDLERATDPDRRG